MEKYQTIEHSIITKFRPTIYRLFVRAIDEYKLIKDGDKVAVCISGGKDSMLLAKCMEEFQLVWNYSLHYSFKYFLFPLCNNILDLQIIYNRKEIKLWQEKN